MPRSILLNLNISFEYFSFPTNIYFVQKILVHIVAKSIHLCWHARIVSYMYLHLLWHYMLHNGIKIKEIKCLFVEYYLKPLNCKIFMMLQVFCDIRFKSFLTTHFNNNKSVHEIH